MARIDSPEKMTMYKLKYTNLKLTKKQGEALSLNLTNSLSTDHQ